MSAPQATPDLRADLEAVRYMLSHDLRAPVRHVRALLDVVREDCAATLDDVARDYVARAAGAAERLDGLLLAVLEFARLALRELRAGPVDLERAVDDALARLAEPIAARGALVTREGLARRVAADRHVLGQLLEHLVGNALKFVAEGQTPRVAIRATADGGRVRLCVADNGIGIAAGQLERIFAMGVRLHGEERFPGYGVGLAYVRRAAERMGGRAGAESAPGSGSTFWVDLPAQAGP